MNGNPYQTPAIPSAYSTVLSAYGLGTNNSTNTNPGSNPLLSGQIDPMELYQKLLAGGFGGARAGGTTSQQQADQQLRSNIFAPGSQYTDSSGGLYQFDNSLTGKAARITTPVGVSQTGIGGTTSQTYNTFGGIQNGDVQKLWNPNNLPVTPYRSLGNSIPSVPISNTSLPTIPQL